MRVLLRLEAGQGIGLGHLRRSLSLAQAMRLHGVEGHFLLHPDPEALALVERAGYCGELLNGLDPFGEADARQTAAAAERLGADRLLIDFDRIPVAYVEALREAGLEVIIRDDLALRALPAQIVINGNADAERLDYRRWGKATRFFLGPRYAVLPREYWQPARRTARAEIHRVLVVLGGSDAGGWMPRLMERLDRIPGRFGVTAVVGPFSDNARQVRATAGRLRRAVEVIDSPESLAPCIADADLAVSAAGQTLYELACFGCPVVSFQAAANQRGQLEALTEAGCVRSAGAGEDPDLLDRIEESLLRLMRNLQERVSMTQAGQRLIDGRGADRVARGLLEESP